MKKYNVMIIEDDFRIAHIHQEMVESNSAFQVVQSSRTKKEALAFLEKNSSTTDVILLDIYIPDVEGLNLLRTLKNTYPFITIIVASAANDLTTFQAAVRLGVFDYLIKPIDKDRLETTFDRLKNIFTHSHQALNQTDVDSLLWRVDFKQTNDATNNLPKGIDSLTLAEIQSFLNAYDQNEITAQTLAKLLGISRATARRYLEYLVGIEWVEASLNYGQVGRPQRIYTIHEQYEQN